MTDRELLELAAKAAGIKYHSYVDEVWGTGINIGEIDVPLWNPLTDDGDALRLAAKLRLELDVCKRAVAVRTPSGIKVLVDANEVDDAYAATRRAIVRAAAEIGKAA